MQILGTTWRPFAFTVAEGTTRRSEPASGEFDWQVGSMFCTGYWHDGWRPCPDHVEIDGQCMACFRGRGDPARRDDQPACIFEPRCKGNPERCVCSFGGIKQPRPHVVYCAFYGPLPKIGMTMAERVDERLTEQGADAYFVITKTDGRASARQTEQAVAKLTGIPEWRRHQEVLPQWTRPVDRARIEGAASKWQKDLARRFEVGTLKHIEHGLAPLPGTPRRIPAEGRHVGTWIGGRGSHVFYSPASTPLGISGAVYALKRSDLIGRNVEIG